MHIMQNIDISPLYYTQKPVNGFSIFLAEEKYLVACYDEQHFYYR